MDALLVIDVERYYGWKEDLDNYSEAEKKIASEMRSLLTEWRAQNGEIIFIMFPPNSHDLQQKLQISLGKVRVAERWAKKLVSFLKSDRDAFITAKICLACEHPLPLAPFLEHRHDPFEPVFFKNTADAFTNHSLAPYLRRKGITMVVLIGCSTRACVLRTAEGAVQSGFSVKLLSRCVTPPFFNNDDKINWIRSVDSSVPSQYKNTVTVQVE